MKKVFFKTQIDGKKFYFVNVNEKNQKNAITAARLIVYNRTGKLPYSIFCTINGKQSRKTIMATAQEF
jgi:hypothetical protein